MTIEWLHSDNVEIEKREERERFNSIEIPDWPLNITNLFDKIEKKLDEEIKELDEQIKIIKKENEKKPRKTSKKKPSKNNSSAYKTAVESLQKKLS